MFFTLDIRIGLSIASATDLVLKKAVALEKCIFTEYSGTTTAYKSKIRSLFVNLKDKNNPSLRESVVSGELAVDRLAKMTSEVRHIRPIVLSTN